MNNITSNDSQLILMVRSFTTPLPDSFEKINEVFPAYELVDQEDEDGTTITVLGDPIVNGSYEQRIKCNPYTQYPMWDKSQIDRILNQNGYIFNPQASELNGMPIPSVSGISEVIYKKINVVPVWGLNQDLILAKKAFEDLMGVTLPQFEGELISPAQFKAYFISNSVDVE